MGQINENFARQMLRDARVGKHTPLTCWEEAQLAWAWLKFNGHSVPNQVFLSRDAMAEDYPVSANCNATTGESK